MRVLVAALNDIEGDVRITKEMDSLQAAGYALQAVGIAEPGVQKRTIRDRNGVLITLAPRIDTAGSGFLRALVRKALVEAAFLLAFVVGVLAFWWSLGPHELKPALAIIFAVALLALVLAVRLHVSLVESIVQALRSVATLMPYYTIGSRPGTGERKQSGIDLAKLEQSSMAVNELLELAVRPPEQQSWPEYLDGLTRMMLGVVETKQFDVVHCHDFTSLPLGLAIKRKRPHIKLVYDSHELFSATVAQRPFDFAYVRSLERKASGVLDGVITVNDSIASKLKGYYPQMPRPVVVCNATRTAKAPIVYDGRLHAAAGLPPDTKILLFQGGFARQRGLDTLIDAAPLLPTGWAVVLMGWGKYQDALVKTIAGKTYKRRDPGGKKIRIVPPAPQDELAVWTAGATVGAILYEPTSLNNYFCSPNKIWEYPLADVPVLCNAAPEVASRVQAYGFGWVLPYEKVDGEAIAEKIAGLSEAAIAEARAGCRRFIAADNWSIYEARLLELYARLAGRKDSAGSTIADNRASGSAA